MSDKLTIEKLEKRITKLKGKITELSRSKKSLQSTKKRILKIFHESPDAIALTDFESGKVIEINKTFEQVFNIPRRKVIGRKSYNLAIWKDIKDWNELIHILKKKGSARDLELKLLRSSGEVFDTVSSVELIEIDGVECVLTYIRDISEKKKIKLKLIESEKKYQSLFKDAQVALFRTSLEGDILEINKKYAQIAGYSSVEECLENFNPGKSWVDRSAKDKYITEINEKGFVKDYETEILDRNNNRVWILLSAAVFKESGYIEGSIIDISYRKKAENELKESKEKFRKVFESANVGKSLTSLDGKIEVNKAFCDFLGYEEEELKGMTWQDITPKEDIEDNIKKLDTVINGERSSTRFDKKYIHKNGNILWGDVSVVLHRDSKDNPLYFITTVIDITDRIFLENQLIQTQKMEAVGQLAGGIAHDFNNMLSVITGYTEMALENTEPENRIYADLKEVENASKRSADIIRQLLAFARKQTVSPVKLDLNSIVESMIKMIKRLIGEDIDLAWHPGKNIWPVLMDPAQIDQILVNLCINARDAISDTGKITIEISNITFDEDYCKTNMGFIPGKYIMMAVSDNGCGMDNKTINKIFEPFFTTKVMGRGTGLGLSTVYGIVKQNGGFINVYSEPGSGTIIKVFLPRFKGEVDYIIENNKGAETASKGEKILIVEDEKSILKLARKILEKFKYEVLTASKPEEAIYIAKNFKGKIDLLITDVVMPGMNGKILGEEIKKIFPSLKILFMSGYTANVIAHHGVLEKGVNFIHKPLSGKSLAQKVREALDS